MEKGDTDTNKTEQPPPSLREEMSRLLESMDPQGLLNMGDREETTHPEGVDHTKSGDVHAAEHDISFTDNGSDAGSGSRQDGSRPDGSGHDDSGENQIGKDSEEMEISTPNFRIVDILPPTSLMMIQPLQPVGAGTDPNPAQTQRAGTGTDGSAAAAEKPASPENHIFAIPSNVVGNKNHLTPPNPVQGKNIFESLSSGTGSENNPAHYCKTRTDHSQNLNTGGNEVPTGSKASKINVSLPPKRPDPVEPDAVPSKTYDAILTRKRAPLVASLPARAPLNVVVFLTRGITGSLGQSIGRMSTV
jgi:hypothetical protein